MMCRRLYSLSRRVSAYAPWLPVALAFACLPSVAGAQVTTETELRDAIIGANEGSGEDIVLGANIVLTGSLPQIETDLNIFSSAPGVARTIDANFVGRVFSIIEGTVTITDVRIVNARAIGGAGGAGTFPGGGGAGVGAAIYVGPMGVLTTTNVAIENAAAQGGAGGAFVALVGGGGGGGLAGAGGAATGLGGGGGGGFAGTGGQGGAGGGGGGGGGALGPWAGDLVAGAGGAGSIGGGGGGGRSFAGGAGGAGVGEGGGGEGGGTSAGAAGAASTGGAGSSVEGGDGGNSGAAGSNAAEDNGGGGGAGSDAAGGNGLRRGGGGGGGADVGTPNATATQTAGGGPGSLGGGGGAGSAGIGGTGSDFGGGGGGGLTGGDAPGFGGGGGGATTGGGSVWGGGGAGGTTAGTSAVGGSGADDGGGGGSALGGAIFVEEGGSLTMNDPAFAGPFAVTGGLGSGSAEDGPGRAALMFSQAGDGRMPTTINITNAATTLTIPGSDALGGGGQFVKAGPGTLLLADSNPNATSLSEFVTTGGTLAAAADEAFGDATIVGNGGALAASGGARSFTNPLTLLAGGLNVTGGESVVLNGVISGVGGLNVALTAGSVNLTGVNTFTGPVTVTSGALVTTGGAAIGDLATVVVTFPATWANGGAETIGSLAGTGNTSLTAGLTVGGNGTSTIYSGVLSGTGPLTKTGAGTFTLSGANTYLLGTIVTGGTLAVSADGNLGQAGTTLTLNGGAFAPLAAFTLPRPIVLDAAGGTIATPLASPLMATGVVSGAGALTKTGTGTLTLTGTNTYAGGTAALAGVLSVSGAAPLGTGAVTFNGAGLQAAAAATMGNAVVLAAATAIDTQANTLTMNGAISGTSALTKAGSGTLALTAVNSFTGATTVTAGTVAISGSIASTAVTVTGGSLTATGGSALADAAALTITAPGSAAFNTSETLGSITGTGAMTLGPGAILTVGGASTTSYSGIIGGTGGLTKAGTGSLALSGAQTYSGATAVSGGTLSVAGSLASSPVQVAGGTLLVTGTIAAPVSVSSGTLRGSGSVGGASLTGGQIQPTSIFTVNGNLNVGASAGLTTAINGVDPNTGFGQVRVVGTVTLAGALNATVGGGFSPSGPVTLVIIDNDGTDTVSGTFSGLAEGASVTIGAVTFRISYAGGDGNDVTLTAGAFLTYLAEGATNAFFDTRIALVNPNPSTAANVTMRFLRSSGGPVEHTLAIPALGRRTVDPETDVPGLENANFSTVVESDTPVVVDRTMSWGAGGYGSHAETSTAAPSTLWYFAEGATHGQFDLFYLLQNATTTAANVEITYLLPGGPVGPRPYTVPGNSRVTIYVDEQPGLAATDVSAIIRVTNGVPISTERAMYVSPPGQPTFSAGTDVAGIPAPATNWFFAEGATGSFFDFYILLANPQSTAASVSITYVTGSGNVTKNYTVAANSRQTISVEQEDALLNSAAIAATLTSSVPILAERALFWPAFPWYEGHASAGVTATGTRWALADGEAGGANLTQTYILIANTGANPASVRMTLLLEAGGTVQRDYTVPANGRITVNAEVDFPAVANQRFGAIVESLGASPQQIVVERSMYTNAGGVIWAAGTNVVASRLQ